MTQFCSHHVKSICLFTNQSTINLTLFGTSWLMKKLEDSSRSLVKTRLLSNGVMMVNLSLRLQSRRSMCLRDKKIKSQKKSQPQTKLVCMNSHLAVCAPIMMVTKHLFLLRVSQTSFGFQIGTGLCSHRSQKMRMCTQGSLSWISLFED